MQNMSENASERSEGHKTPVEHGSLPSRYIPRPQNPTRAPSYTLRRDGTGRSAIIRVLQVISAGANEAMRQLQRCYLASRFITRAHKPTGAPFCSLRSDGKGAPAHRWSDDHGRQTRPLRLMLFICTPVARWPFTRVDSDRSTLG